MSVRNGPAEMVLTRTVGPYSRANAVVSALSPAFAAAYGPNRGCGIRAPDDDTLMTEPPPAATIRGPISEVSRNGPLRFPPTTLSNSSSLVSSDDGASGDIPALFTRTSTRPN